MKSKNNLIRFIPPDTFSDRSNYPKMEISCNFFGTVIITTIISSTIIVCYEF